MNNKNILITGGLGFIGSNFINYLINTYDSFNLINLDFGGIGSNKSNVIQPRTDKQIIHHINWDISKELTNPIIKLPFDLLINFAAESHVDRSISTPKPFITSNVLGTLQMLEFAKNNNVKKFIQISTDEVYGSIVDGSFKENNSYNPSSVYSASKASAEMLCNAYKKTYDMDIIITRCTNNYGINQFEEKLIPVVIRNALDNRKIPVYDEGKQRREWVHVYSHIQDICFLCLYSERGNIYNVGRGYEISNIDLVKKILDIMNKPHDLIEFKPNFRLGHDFRYSINTKKIQDLIKIKDPSFIQKNPNMKIFEKNLNNVITHYLNKWNN